MPEKFRIESLEIEGFRGFNERKELRFDKPFVILHGDNGHGKSSTLGAIEWCLFGDFVSVKSLESRTKDELINSINAAGTAKVRLVLSNGDGRYEIVREKKVGKRKANFIVKAPSGEYKMPVSEKLIQQIFGLNLEDFQRTVFLHQESVRGLLTDDPSKRDEAMDRLFGLEKLRDVIESIPISSIKKELSGLDNEKSRLQERMKGALLEIEKKIKSLEEDAKELSLRKDDISFKNASQISKEIISNLKSVGKEYSLEIPQIAQPQNNTTLKVLTKNAKSVINKCRKSMPETTELDSLNSQRSDLVDIQSRYKGQIASYRKLKTSLASISSKYGAPSRIDNSIVSVTKKIQDLERQRKQTGVKSRILQDAAEYFASSTEKICPICSQKIDRGNVMSQIKRHIRKHGEKIIESIKRKIDASERQIKDLKQAKADVKDLQAQLKKVEKGVSSVMAEINKSLGKPKVAQSKLPKLLSSEIAKIDGKIRRIQNSIRGREKQFQKIENKIDRVKTIHEILAEEGRRDEIDKLFSAERNQINILKKEITSLKSFQNDLEFIMRTVADYQINLAKNMIGRSSRDIQRFCTKLCGHPYFSALEIKVDPKETKGQIKNTYSIKALNPSENKETFVSTRFSVGQMNCVALSIYLALSRILPHKLGFLILDDPSQSLDVNHQHALVELLKTVNHNHQIIVSTHDEQFKKLVTSQLKPRGGKHLYNYVSWSKRGPEIRASK